MSAAERQNIKDGEIEEMATPPRARKVATKTKKGSAIADTPGPATTGETEAGVSGKGPFDEIEGGEHTGPAQDASEPDESAIRRLAYEIWEQEGRQSGREEEYWHRAREILRTRHSAT